MTRIGLFASVAMLGMSLGAGQAARAADMAAHTMAVKVPPAAPVPAAPSWTGFYVGLGGGYGWSDPTVTFSPPITLRAPLHWDRRTSLLLGR